MNPRLVEGGFFVSFEGIECTGKSTQCKILADRLRQDGYAVVETREPGGTRVGEELRHIVKHIDGEDAVGDEAELLIFCASRAHLMQKKILPHLNSGGIVLCDRFADSTTAYQGFGRGGSLNMIATLHEYTTFGRWPAMTFLFDLEVSLSFERGKLRAEENNKVDRIENESKKFHERVRQGFLSIARKEPTRISIIDASQSRVEIQNLIIEKVLHALNGFS